jgi:hypothetical protein
MVFKYFDMSQPGMYRHGVEHERKTVSDDGEIAMAGVHAGNRQAGRS